MIRYNISEFRSRDGPALGVEPSRPVGTAQRERSLPASLHRASVRWSLLGSLGGHAALLVALLSLTGRVMPPIAQEPASVALVLEASAPAAAPVPEAPSPAPHLLRLPHPRCRNRHRDRKTCRRQRSRT